MPCPLNNLTSWPLYFQDSKVAFSEKPESPHSASIGAGAQSPLLPSSRWTLGGIWECQAFPWSHFRPSPTSCSPKMSALSLVNTQTTRPCPSLHRIPYTAGIPSARCPKAESEVNTNFSGLAVTTLRPVSESWLQFPAPGMTLFKFLYIFLNSCLLYPH